jgi:peptide/nickel transport system substrate-binding protein/oligopeptide transport system substrate-binding protein
MMTLLLVALTGCGLLLPVPQPTPDPKLPDSQQIFHPQEIGPANGDLETLDPALIEFQTDYDNAQLLFPALVTLDEHSQPIDWAASSHEVSADGLTYTFHLRAGMTWSDGAPIDATTYAYAINRSEDPCTDSPNANYLDPIKGATALYHETCPTGATHVRDTLIGKSVIASDPQTLTIILAQPAGYFLTALTSATAWAVPQQLIEQYADKWTEHLADNGGFGGNLYRLTRWDHAGHLEFERNARFWGKKPLLRRIESTLYQSTEAAWNAFTTSKEDTSQPPLDSLTGSSRWTDTVIQQTPQLSLSWLTPNWQIAPFDDLRVRQAFSLALDRHALATAASSATSFSSLTVKDLRFPSIHLLPEGMPGYNPCLADAAGRTGTGALAPALTPARALASSYAAERCGGDFASCPPVNLCLRSGSFLPTAANTLTSEWTTAFPGWRIFSGGGCDRQQVFQGQAIQFYTSGWLADYPDPHDFITQLWTTHAPYPFHHPVVSIPAVDALCAQADASSDQAVRISLYQQAEQLLVNQVAAIPLYQSTATYIVRSRVVGWRMTPAGQTPLSVWQQVYIRR